MQAVGKFNENNSDIFRHGEKHAPEILRLFFLFGLKSYLVELGYAQHKLAYLVAEFVAYFAVGGGRVLYAVVQKRGGNGLVIESEVEQNIRHGYGVYYIRLAAVARLPVVHARRVVVNLVEYLYLIGRKYFLVTLF